MTLLPDLEAGMLDPQSTALFVLLVVTFGALMGWMLVTGRAVLGGLAAGLAFTLSVDAMDARHRPGSSSRPRRVPGIYARGGLRSAGRQQVLRLLRDLGRNDGGPHQPGRQRRQFGTPGAPRWPPIPPAARRAR